MVSAGNKPRALPLGWYERRLWRQKRAGRSVPKNSALHPSLQSWLVIRRVFGQMKTMSLLASVTIHPSQFPQNVRRDLIESLKSRRINHKFHYDSVHQTQKW